MKIECKKCGFKGEGHRVGRYSIPYVIIQCPKCCFIYDLVKLESLIKQKSENL